MARSGRIASFGLHAFILTAALLLPFAATASEQVPGLNDSGPGGGVKGVMERSADVKRIGGRIFSRLMRQSDSTLALICFERSLALSGRLGAIYSDVPPPKIMPPTRNIFDGGNLYNPYAGIALRGDGRPGMLVNAYGTLASALDSYMGNAGVAALPGVASGDQLAVETPAANFAGSITDGMGATQVTALPLFSAAIYNLVRSAGGTGAFSETLTNNYPSPMTELFDATLAEGVGARLQASLDNARDALEASKGMSGSYDEDPNVIENGIPEYYTHLTTAMEHRLAIYEAINDQDEGLANGFKGSFLSLDHGLLGSSSASLTGLSWTDLQAGVAPDPAEGCYTIASLFGGIPGNQLGIQGLTRDGPDKLKPYFTYSDLVTGDIKNSDNEVAEELGGGGVAASIRDLARDDLLYVTSRPGTPTSLSNWTAAPEILPGATPADIVGVMP